MVASIEADFGPMSILINNAGIASRGLSVADTNPEEVDKLFAVHAAGPHRLSFSAPLSAALIGGEPGDLLDFNGKAEAIRSEERRGGKECGSKCRTRWLQ